MNIYEVTAKVRLDLIEEYEKFMLERHMPDLVDTGHFQSAELAQVTDGIYRARYKVEDRAALENYFETDVIRLREDFSKKFPEGVVLSREILDVLKTWEVD